MSKNSISVTKLSSEIQKILQKNAGRITDKVKVLSKETTEDLTKDTKKDSPVLTGEHKRHISNKKVKETSTSVVYVWHVKDPEYRLTHLIANGHAKRNGGRVEGNFPLADDVEKAETKFIKGVKEIVENEC